MTDPPGPDAGQRHASGVGAVDSDGEAVDRAVADPERPLHHTVGGFQNPPGSPQRQRRRNRVLKFLWRQRVHARPIQVPPDLVLAPEEVTRGLAQYAGQPRVTWLGHAAFLIGLAGRRILIDPFLSDWAGPAPGLGPRRFTPPALTAATLPPIDLLLISHNHYDHLDLRTIAALPHRDRIEAVVPLGLGPLLREAGIRQVTELDWHQHHRVHGLTVTATPAQHRSARGLHDRNRTLWAGFAIEGEGRRLYFGGDTGYGPIFRETGRRHGPFDLAMIGIGCYAPRAAMQVNHADPEEAIQIGLDLGARHLIGMHWGALVMTEEPPFEPPQRFRAAAAAAGFSPDEAWLLRIGETRAIPEGALAVRRNTP